MKAQSSDDELAEAIVCELYPNGTAEKSWALNHVKSHIEDLRSFVQMADTEPRPSEAKKTIEQIVGHADALASCIEKLSPNWRWYLSFSMFCARSEDGIPAPWPDSDRKARSSMDEWLFDLKEISHAFGQLPDSLRDYFPEPQEKCADTACKIIRALAPATELTKGDQSKFYAVTSFLWEAISGEKEKSMKRACDNYIDFIKDIRDQEHEVAARGIAANQPEE